MARVPLIAPIAAVIVAMPAVVPDETRPLAAPTEATLGALLLHANVGAGSTLLVESFATAENCRVRVAVTSVSNVMFVEATVIVAATCATTIGIAPDVTPLNTAVMDAEPGVTAVTSPVPLTLATDATEEVHVTLAFVAVTPALDVPVTLSCTVRPRAPKTMAAAGGVMAIVVGVTTGVVTAVPPPQPHVRSKGRSAANGRPPRRTANDARVMTARRMGLGDHRTTHRARQARWLLFAWNFASRSGSRLLRTSCCVTRFPPRRLPVEVPRAPRPARESPRRHGRSRRGPHS